MINWCEISSIHKSTNSGHLLIILVNTDRLCLWYILIQSHIQSSLHTANIYTSQRVQEITNFEQNVCFYENILTVYSDCLGPIFETMGCFCKTTHTNHKATQNQQNIHLLLNSSNSNCVFASIKCKLTIFWISTRNTNYTLTVWTNTFSVCRA